MITGRIATAHIEPIRTLLGYHIRNMDNVLSLTLCVITRLLMRFSAAISLISLGSTQDLVHVIAVASDMSKLVFISL